MDRLPIETSGTSDFSVVWGDRSWQMTNPHIHAEVEMGLLEQGESTLVVGGRAHRLTAGRMHLLSSIVPHQTLDMSDDVSFIIFTAPLAWFMQLPLPEGFVHQTLAGELWMEPSNLCAQADLQMMRRWLTDANDPNVRPLCLLEAEVRVRRLAANLGSQITEKNTHHPLHADRLGKVEQIVAFIAEHYAKPIQVADVAQHVGLAPNYTMRLFKQHWGISIGRYIIEHRLWRARQLLACSDMKIDNIAREVGFASPSQLYTLFQSHLNQTPGSFRRSILNRPS